MAKSIKITDLHKALMHREDWTLEEAEQEINTMRNRVQAGENPDDILFEIGLEPDYFFDLM